MNILQDIDASIRKRIYMVFAGVSLALGATQVGFSAADVAQPTWLIVALAVYAFLAGGVGLTAVSNTQTPQYEWTGSSVQAQDIPDGYEDGKDPEDV